MKKDQQTASIVCAGDDTMDAAVNLRSPPFQTAGRFIAVRQTDGTVWHGVTTLLCRVDTVGGACYDVAYVKWLSLPLTGAERDMLPVPSGIPCLQWAVVDAMGIGSTTWQPQSFGVVSIADVICVAPIIQFGNLPGPSAWRNVLHPIVASLAQCAVAERRSSNGERRLPQHWPWSLLRPGPLFMLNEYAYMEAGDRRFRCAGDSATRAQLRRTPRRITPLSVVNATP